MHATAVYYPSRSMKDKLLVAGGYLLYYACIWAPLFGISWVLQRFVDDPVLKTIFDVLYYAGYPIYAAVLIPLGLIYLAGIGVFWVVGKTAPYSLYVFAFSPAVILFIWFKNRYITTKESAEEKRRRDLEALKKHKPFNPFDDDTKL